MSFFASQTQSDPIYVPFDMPNTIVVRQLTGAEYETVCEAHRAGVAGGRPTLWPALFRKALTAGAANRDVQKAIADPLTGHDRYTLVKLGLVSCSRPLPMSKADPLVAMTLAEAIDDMGDEALDFAATEVLRKTKPALFVVSEAVEDANTQPAAVAPAA